MNDQLIDIKSLLAYTLRENPGSYLIESIFNRFPTPADLLDVTERELLTIEGIGKVRAKQIMAALTLSKAIAIPPPSNVVIRSPEDAYQLLKMELSYLKKEHFVVLFLNTKNAVIAKETISIGSLNASIVHPREVFRPAIKHSSASIICMHNHPSGNPEPSPEDIEITERLVSTGILIGISVIDHIIIGHHSYVSLKERGLIS